MSNKNDKVELIHLAGCREDYKSLDLKLPPHLELVEVEPDFDLMIEWLEKVGGDWQRREEFQLEDLKKFTLQRIKAAGARLFLLAKRGKEVGIAQTVEELELSEMFLSAQGTARHFFKFGLVEDERFCGLGAPFAAAVVRRIFEENKMVYFNTRPSNQVNAVNFWQKQGFKIVGKEEISNDVMPE